MADKSVSQKTLVWSFARLHLVGTVLSLGIFAATYFAYFAMDESHSGGSYWPLAIGACAFFGLMYTISYLGTYSQSNSGRAAIAAGIASIATVVFVGLIMFLLLNTFGS